MGPSSDCGRARRDILARDPLANGSTTLDPARFLLVNPTFPYEPPYSLTDPVIPITTNISDSSTETTGRTTEDTYTVGLSMSESGKFFDYVKTTLKETAKWDWTNKSSISSATGKTQSASATVGGPAYGYNGPTVMQVYIDTIYHTFAFALVPVELQEVGVKGKVATAAGKPMPAAEVILVEKGIKHRTFTNAKGEFVFFGSIRVLHCLVCKQEEQIMLLDLIRYLLNFRRVLP